MKRLSTQLQVSLFNEYSLYGLPIPYQHKNEFKCIDNEYKDPTSWLFRLGNEFFGNYFRILYSNWTAYVYYFGKELHQPYSEILNMPFYEMLLLFDYFQDDVEKQNKDSEERQMSIDSEMRNMRNSMNSMQNMQNSQNAPKMPDMSNLNNIKLPNFNS